MNYTEKAERLLGALKRKAAAQCQGTEGHEPGGQFEEAHREVPRLEQLRRLKRNGRQLTPKDSVELNDLELAEKAKLFEAAERCQRKDGTTYGTRGKCRKGTPVAAKEVALPKRVATLEKLAKGKLPENEAKRRALYFGAHKRLGVLGNNPTNPKQQNDGHQRERAALNKLVSRLDEEFNSFRKLTREQVLRAVGTVE